MTSPGKGTLRAVRVFLLATTVVALSLVMHLLAGGDHPGTVSVLVLAGLTTLALLPPTRREITLPGLVVMLSAGQIVLHVAFEQCALLAAAPTAAHHPTPAPSGWMMIVAHVVATLVTAVVLRHGEALLWRLRDWLVGRRLPGRPHVVVASGPESHTYLSCERPAFTGRQVQERAPPLAT